MRLPFAILLALLTTHAVAGEGPWASFTDPILAKARLLQGRYGIEVRELQSGKLLFADGAQNPLNPASTIKTLTSVTALSKLGPNFRFTTEIRQAGKDLCLVGQGDPSLVNERIWLLVQAIRRKGIKRISGDLIADDSLFSPTRQHLKAFRGDGGRAFTAPIGALSANFNSLTIYASPTKLGQPPKISLDPNLSIFQVQNRARTASRAVRRDLSASIRRTGGSYLISVGGKVSKKAAQVTIYRAFPDPAIYAASIFAEQFRKAGGTIDGTIRKGTCPAQGISLLKFSSKPLSAIIFDLNKFSNNFIAEMLLRSVGHTPTAAAGLLELTSWLKKRTISTKGLVLENASGLSRKTRITAHTLVSIVRTATNDLTIGPEFLTSFGIGGTDGTLRRRFRHTPDGSLIRAKSGSLYGVVSLTGLLQRSDGRQVVFATIFNLPSRPNWKLQQLEESLILAWMNAKSR